MAVWPLNSVATIDMTVKPATFAAEKTPWPANSAAVIRRRAPLVSVKAAGGTAVGRDMWAF